MKLDYFPKEGNKQLQALIVKHEGILAPHPDPTLKGTVDSAKVNIRCSGMRPRAAVTRVIAAVDCDNVITYSFNKQESLLV